MAQIALVPETLDLVLYAGDGIQFKLTCVDETNAPINLTGTVEAQIRLDRLTPTDPPLAEFGVDLTGAASGEVILSLTGLQTQDLLNGAAKPGKFTGVWDVQWTATGSEPRTLCQGKVDCNADVTR